jgi:hypothetical protein
MELLDEIGEIVPASATNFVVLQVLPFNYCGHRLLHKTRRSPIGTNHPVSTHRLQSTYTVDSSLHQVLLVVLFPSWSSFVPKRVIATSLTGQE